MPAGDYYIQRMFPQAPNVVQIIMDSDGVLDSRFHFTTPVRGNQPLGPAKLVFNTYGEVQFLSQLWLTGSVSEFRASDAERELAASIARVQTEIALGQ